MPRRYPRVAPSRLASHIQAKVSQASSALSDILDAMREHEGKVKKARGSGRQSFLRDALRILQQLPVRTAVTMEDPDLGVVTLGGLEEELQELSAETSAGMQRVLAQAEGNLEGIRDRMARLEALYVTLGRGLMILQAPQQAGREDLDPMGQLQFDLDEQISSLSRKIGSMLRMLESTRDAEHLRISSLRPQVERALELLHRAGVVPRKGSRVGWQSSRQVPTRNRLAGAIK